MNDRLCHKAIGLRLVNMNWGTGKLKEFKQVLIGDSEFKGADGCKEATIWSKGVMSRFHMKECLTC